MSYNFVVEIKEGADGKKEAAFETTDFQLVPLGKFQIAGHCQDDGKNELLNVTRKSVSGDSVAMAQTWHA